MVSMNVLLLLLLQLVVVGTIFFVLWWALGKIGLPEPFNKIATVLIVVLCAIFIINILLGLLGHPLVRFSDTPSLAWTT
jgi:hypothetical protein